MDNLYNINEEITIKLYFQTTTYNIDNILNIFKYWSTMDH
jgi:hypothetical protein